MKTQSKILVSVTLPLLMAGVFSHSATVAQMSPSPMMSPSPRISPGPMSQPGNMMAANTVKFTCSQGKAFVATFQQDKARVLLLDTRQDLMMHQVQSGSGIQYVNAGYHLFSKGKEARIEINGKPAYENCVTP